MDHIDPARLRRKLGNLTRLRDQLTDQKSILKDSRARAPNWEGASDPQMVVLRELFQEAETALPEKNIRFTDNNDFDGLIAQISSAQSKVVEAISDIGPTLGIVPTPALRDEVPTASPPDPRKVLVVHGRNEAFRQAMFSFLRAIGLDPIEWEEAISMTGQSSPYIGQAIDAAFANARAAVVLLTGDDLACLKEEYISQHDDDTERKPTPQARPNVLFELGMAFGRKPEHTIIVEFGKTRPISDSIGRNVIRFVDTPEFRQKLAGRLLNAGCAVNTSFKSDWLTANFHFPSIVLGPISDLRFPSVAPKLVPEFQTPAATVEPRAELATPNNLPVKWPEGLTAHLAIEKGATLGVSVFVGNDRDTDIPSFVLHITEAAFWSETHKKFLPQPFAGRAIVSANNLRAMNRTPNTPWLLRVFREGDEHCLAVGDDNRNLLKPPNYEPQSSVETWKLTLQMSCDLLLNLDAKKNATVLKPFYLVIWWDTASRLLSMSEA